MASPNDPDGTRTLPRAELNPLLNPRLAENMGRWAEVYFTAPPEKREEAVLDLLRELEAGKPQSEKADLPPVAASPAERSDSLVTFENASRETASDIRCGTCGHENPASHQFCGMCGQRMSGADAPAAFSDSDLSARDAHENSVHDAGKSNGSEGGSASGNRHDVGFDENSDEMTRLRRISDSSFRGDLFEWDAERSPSRSYRWYIVAALALALFVAVYVAWRDSKTKPTADSASPATEASASQAPSTTLPRTDAPATTAPAVPPPESKNVENVPSNIGAKSVPRTEPFPSTKEEGGNAAPSGNGTEELATAQRYLNGGNGQERNGAEAAQWLWKSIAKHNSEAPLLLADLYLRGDGVSKNCDQARVLLDSAARKGVAGAGERLRNLQAFGCQ